MSIFNSNTTTQQEGITQTLLDEITDAYNLNDIDAVMSFFAEDAVLTMPLDQTLMALVFQD